MDELFSRFVDVGCGNCHTNGQRAFDVSGENFATVIDEDVLARVMTDDPSLVMPPGAGPYSARGEDDPLRQYAELLREWVSAGRPVVFAPASMEAAGDEAATSPFLIGERAGRDLTNLGSCKPQPGLVATETEAMREADRRFAGVRDFSDLPKSLRETDFISLDSEVLARHGVLSYAPAYTLWADDAGKMRYVRVPEGEAIRFDEATQSFDIPDNTRFYKTFLKPVTDLDGRVRYRKLETRIIVVRKDREDKDGVPSPTALFGSYKWNEDETEALLHDVPYRDGDGFTDDIQTYVVDERLEDQVIRRAPERLDEALLESGARRHYPIPGADRCIQCHMGSPTANFVLGFSPLQIHRRPEGQGGVIEPAARDELNQLQRLIDYGAITGIAGPDEVTLLEDSQGKRSPRNEYELEAQGYMIGNCAHCHNPRGFPSLRAPELADVLDFQPGEDGGIFEFPLERYSPRSFRGAEQEVRIPYITPSLYDQPQVVAEDIGVAERGLTAPKWITLAEPSEGELSTLGWVASEVVGDDNVDGLLVPAPGRPLLAPWRSMIYRNVDAPFSYEEGSTIFPHMPMHTPGYDCRARQVLGRWMVSIPARLKEGAPDLPEELHDYGERLSTLEQPYEEVEKGLSASYSQASRAAVERVQRFLESERYSDCPDPALDTLAPEVASGRSLLPLGQQTTLYNLEGEEVEEYRTAAPARPHYAKTDARDDLTWNIRRPDWPEVLLTGVDGEKQNAGGTAAKQSRILLPIVSKLRLTEELRSYATTPVPYGLWVEKSACSSALEEQKTVADLKNGPGADWFAYAEADDTAPVYAISRGEQVFQLVCSNCHGPSGNGESVLATTIIDLTGGRSRVANLRDGLFGPPSAPGENRAMEFAQAGGGQDGAEQWAARYLVWMGLGGTNAAIPKTVLAKIGAATVLGQHRARNFTAVKDDKGAANMLTVATKACATWLEGAAFEPHRGRSTRLGLEERGFLSATGELDLWASLCAKDNALPVRAVRIHVDQGGQVSGFTVDSGIDQAGLYTGIYLREAYPLNASVGGAEGISSVGLQAENTMPFCIIDPPATTAYGLGDSGGTLTREELLERARQKVIADSRADERSPELPNDFALPLCPSASEFGSSPTGSYRAHQDDVLAWALRGAANAGLAVFAYLDAVARDEITPSPAYDRCEALRN